MKAKMTTDGTIKLAGGLFFEPLKPDPTKINVHDIAHALARQCRFGGHLPCEHYSVAEHAVRVYREVKRRAPTFWLAHFWALHHDDTEAYFIDLPKPIKERYRNCKKSKPPCTLQSRPRTGFRK